MDTDSTVQNDDADDPLGAAEPLAASLMLAELADDKAREMAQVFRLLADETRLRIVHYLMQRSELNVRTLCSLLKQSQPAVSHHLALMRVAGILECRRDGKHNFYRLVPKRCSAYLTIVSSGAGDSLSAARETETIFTFRSDGNAAS